MCGGWLARDRSGHSLSEAGEGHGVHGGRSDQSQKQRSDRGGSVDDYWTIVKGLLSDYCANRE